MANSVIDTFEPTLRRNETFASIYKHPSQPREHLRIRKITFPDGSTTPDADAVAAAAPSGPDETKSGPKGVDSNANQKWRESLEERIKKLVRFGLTYGDDTESAISRAKDMAWMHITTEKDGGESCYLTAIKDIEKEVVECYDDTIKRNIKRGDEFRRKMARDGCFFLQLSLYILGGGRHLGYPATNPFFGENIDNRCWIPDMFFFGNQIPYVVIDALMNQPFFKDVIRRGEWRRPSDGDVVKLVLYQTVVEPQLTTEGKKVADACPRDFNMVTALRNALLGSNTNDDPLNAVMTRWFQDMEHGHKDNNLVHFPSATEFKRSGVTLRKAKGGIANIRFKNRSYSAILYLPPLHIHGDYMSLLLTSVVQLEKSLPEMEREVTSYVSLLRDLTPTYKDFNILKDQGILIFSADDLRDAVSGILCFDKVVPQSESYLTPNLRDIMLGIKEYKTVPWQQMSFTCSIACGIVSFFLAVFTIIQTVFTVLSYYHTINPPT